MYWRVALFHVPLDEVAQVHGLGKFFVLGYFIQIRGDFRGYKKGKPGVGASVDVIDKVIDRFLYVCNRVLFADQLFIVVVTKQTGRVADTIEDEDGLMVLQSEGYFVAYRDTGERRFRNHAIAVLDPAFQFFMKRQPFLAGLQAHLVFRRVQNMIALHGMSFGLEVADDGEVIFLKIFFADQ